jgi:hypothetical protein
MGSLPKERFKATGASLRNPDPDGQTARFYLAMVRPPAQSVRPPAPGTEALGPILGTRGHVHVTAVKLLMSTHFLATPLGRISC